MIPGETILTGAPATCPTCGTRPDFGLYRSAAGWYIGTYCDCGPYSRESEYFTSARQGEDVLARWREGEYEYART